MNSPGECEFGTATLRRLSDRFTGLYLVVVAAGAAAMLPEMGIE
jgi:hypothetical protein